MDEYEESHEARPSSLEEGFCWECGKLFQWRVILSKKFKFSPKWVNISLCSVLQFSYPLLFKFFILHLPSYGADFFDNDCSLFLLSSPLYSCRQMDTSNKWQVEWGLYCENFVMIGLTADAGGHFKNRATIPLAPCTNVSCILSWVLTQLAPFFLNICFNFWGCKFLYCILLDARVSKSSRSWTRAPTVVTNNKINYSRAVNSQDQRVSTLPPWRMIDAKELKNLFEFKTHKYGGYLRQSVMGTERYGWLDYSWSTPNSRSKREAQHSSITIPISQAWYWSQPRWYCSHQRILKLGEKGGSV